MAKGPSTSEILFRKLGFTWFYPTCLSYFHDVLWALQKTKSWPLPFDHGCQGLMPSELPGPLLVGDPSALATSRKHFSK